MEHILQSLRLVGTAILLPLLVLSLVLPMAASSQEPTSAETEAATVEPVERAPVILDGEELFRVRGSSALPAKERAAEVHARIVEAAENPAFEPESIELRVIENGVELWGGGQRIFVVINADARLEGLEAAVLAETIRQRIIRAIVEYRQSRSGEGVRNAIQISVLATLAFVAVIAILIFSARVASRQIDRFVIKKVENLERKAQNIVETKPFWEGLRIALWGVFLLLGAIALYYYVSTVLLALPWTRSLAVSAFALVSNPLVEIGLAILHAIPDLIALLVIILLTRLILKLVNRFFERVGRGRIVLRDFERDWAKPTNRLVKIVIIFFALVMAYPYIPGSQSEAFKGISIFAGVLLSFGSSSFIANIIAGYSMIYRRAFRVGDRVMISGIVGDVVDMRLLAVHVVTLKNERITFSNSQVLVTEVTNYSAQAARDGVILHTEVGIGYEVPWRDVQTLLLSAADRTPNLLKNPPPFVLQKRLGDFAPVYELNAYTDNEKAMESTYSALHASIQDAFAEAGVQIMTPNYVADPAEEKIPTRSVPA